MCYCFSEMRYFLPILISYFCLDKVLVFLSAKPRQFKQASIDWCFIVAKEMTEPLVSMTLEMIFGTAVRCLLFWLLNSTYGSCEDFVVHFWRPSSGVFKLRPADFSTQTGVVSMAPKLESLEITALVDFSPEWTHPLKVRTGDVVFGRFFD